MGPGCVDALIDVARGPCVDSVAVRGEITAALLGLAGAVGEALPEAGEWLGVEGQLEALGRIKTGTTRLLGELESKLSRRALDGLVQLSRCVELAQCAVRDIVREILVLREWTDGERLHRVYGGTVAAWRRVRASSGTTAPRQEALLRSVSLWAAEYSFCMPSLSRGARVLNECQAVQVVEGMAAVQERLNSIAASMRVLGESSPEAAGGELRSIASALGELEATSTPEVAAVTGEGTDGAAHIALPRAGRARWLADGGGLMLEWRLPCRVGVWAGDKEEGVWARGCLEVVRGLLLGQRLNSWARAAGASGPVQEVLGLAVQLEQEGANAANPLGLQTTFVLQAVVAPGIPLDDVVGCDAWEDMAVCAKEALARECLTVLQRCELSGAGYVLGSGGKVLVVEGSKRAGMTAEVVNDVLQGAAIVRLCAGSVGHMLKEDGEDCGWGAALQDVFGSATAGVGADFALGGMLESFEEVGSWGTSVKVAEHQDVAAALQSVGGSDEGMEWARYSLSSGAMGQVWDSVVRGGGEVVRGLWGGMRWWRADVLLCGGSLLGTTSSQAMEGVATLALKGAENADVGGLVGLWPCLVSGGDVKGSIEQVLRERRGDAGLRWTGKRDMLHLQHMKDSASKGDMVDCLELAGMLCHGVGIRKNAAEGCHWLKVAAQQGNASCQFLLADAHMHGDGVAHDCASAARLFLAAAEQGHGDALQQLWALARQGQADALESLASMAQQGNADVVPELVSMAEQGQAAAQHCLGKMYGEGIGGVRDAGRARQWFEAAAAQGHAAAQLALGDSFRDGTGGMQDLPAAVKWFRAAAEQGLIEAQRKLGIMLEHGPGSAKNRTEAAEWYRRAAEKGDAVSQWHIGCMHRLGQGVSQDHAEAHRWFVAAAEQGLADAQVSLGDMYKTGTGVCQDESEALRLFRAAAEQGHSGGQVALGDAYAGGTGIAQDEAEALRWYRAAAEQGDPEGQCKLGDAFCHGHGTWKDVKEAVRWYRAAAEQRYSDGLFNFATMYSNGWGVKRNPQRAFELYAAAAELGHAGGHVAMGDMYRAGSCVSQSDSEAVRCFRAAALLGNADGQCSLGTMYKHGYGVPQDDAVAVRWFRAAAKQGHVRAKTFLGCMHTQKDGQGDTAKEGARYLQEAAGMGDALAQCHLAKLYLQAQGVAQDEAEAVRLLKEAAEKGEVEAQCLLGDMYKAGRGVKKDLKRAVHWYRLVAEKGVAEGHFKLGLMFSKGKGVRRSAARALECFQAAAEQGHAGGQSSLGDAFRHGKGTERNDAEAARWYEAAAKQGDAQGQFQLGTLFKFGKGVPRDVRQAARWLKASAEQGHAGGQFAYGTLLRNGKGTPRHFEEALRWWRAAAEQGHDAAIATLTRMKRWP